MRTQRRWLALPVLLMLAGISHAQGPPIEAGPFCEPDLVELIKLDPRAVGSVRV